jgi:threonyl-tRNA synthetase
MKNLYLVIKSNGDVVDPKEYLKESDCQSEFKVVIEREALGVKQDESISIKPEYLYFANKLGFKWEPNSSIGFVQYDHKADLIMRLVKEYARKLVNELDLPIYEVKGSNFFDMDYPVVKAYAGLFGDRLFIQKNEDKELVMSYDASYPQFNLAGQSSISNEAIPFAHFSISDCYRYEQSGECMLLYRGRRFFMPDLHPYFRDVDEAFSYYFKLEDKILESVKMANRKYWNIVKVSSLENWEKYQEQIKLIAINKQEPLLVEIRRDNSDRYWIIDVDYSIVDSFNQVREIACIQIDIGNAKRLGIEYLDSDGVKKNPVIIHSAIPGGIERFIYMLLDKYKESYPLWLSPVQVRIIPVGEKHVEAVKSFLIENKNLNLRIEIDDRAESVSKKIKLSHEDLVPVSIVFGDKEVEDSSSVLEQLQQLSLVQVNFPFIPFSWPKQLSKQIK